VGRTVEEFRHKNEVLDGHCAAIKRDPASIQRSVQVFMNPDDIAGSRQTVQDFIEAGATHLILNLRAPYPQGIVKRLAEEMAEPLKAQYEG
jgi:hypothetical protein